MPGHWICDCTDRESGGHIIEPHYSACVLCGARRADHGEIVVSSGLGGVFSVVIEEVLPDGCRVKTKGNAEDFDDMPAMVRPFRDIQGRKKRKKI